MSVVRRLSRRVEWLLKGSGSSWHMLQRSREGENICPLPNWTVGTGKRQDAS